MHIHIPAASSLIYHPFKILDIKSPHCWKSNQHILTGLIRAWIVWICTQLNAFFTLFLYMLQQIALPLYNYGMHLPFPFLQVKITISVEWSIS